MPEGWNVAVEESLQQGAFFCAEFGDPLAILLKHIGHSDHTSNFAMT